MDVRFSSPTQTDAEWNESQRHTHTQRYIHTCRYLASLRAHTWGASHLDLRERLLDAFFSSPRLMLHLETTLCLQSSTYHLMSPATSPWLAYTYDAPTREIRASGCNRCRLDEPRGGAWAKADSPLGFRVSPCLRSDKPQNGDHDYGDGSLHGACRRHPPEPTAFKVETDGSMGETFCRG